MRIIKAKDYRDLSTDYFETREEIASKDGTIEQIKNQLQKIQIMDIIQEKRRTWISNGKDVILW